MKQALIALIFCAVASSVTAQLPMAHTDVFYAIDTTYKENDLLLRITNTNFFKNDEYFSDYIEGYTLVGYKLQPTLVYYVSSDISIEAGLQLLQYGGTKKYDKIYPILTAQWRINNWATFIMGMLDGHLAHDLPESMWEPERQLYDKPEMGFQIKLKHDNWKGEGWLNWQQFIKNNDTIPERVTAGLSYTLSPQSATDAKWSFEMPIRLIFSHIGGQISNFSQRMQSLANGSLSAILHRNINRKWLKSISAEMQAQYFDAMVDGNIRPFSNGWALYPQLSLEASKFNANIGYWRASNFFSLYGNPTFMSLSNYDDTKYCKNRRMITAEANFYHSIHKILKFSIGAKAYHDVDASQFDYSYHIDFVLTPVWKIYGSDKKTRK